MNLNSQINVSNLFYYPLKSGTEIEVKEVEITETGIPNDRVFILLDKKTKNFLSIKTNWKVYYIKLMINSNIAKIVVPNFDKTFEFDLQGEYDKSSIIEVNYWKNKINGLILNEEINKAISDYLCQEVLLVYAMSKRDLKDDKKFKKCVNVNVEKDKTYFTDLAPYHLISQESLNEVNRKLQLKGEDPVKLNNFRPNIVISGCGVPFFEDKCHKIKIGNAIFRRIIGCVRCKLTTFDSDKGKFRTSLEPLETLYENKTDENLGGCVFGQYFCCDIQEGFSTTIKVGDEVTLLTND